MSPIAAVSWLVPGFVKRFAASLATRRRLARLEQLEKAEAQILGLEVAPFIAQAAARHAAPPDPSQRRLTVSRNAKLSAIIIKALRSEAARLKEERAA